jgi:5'-nucleotidase (lipoprotein e(P4) family)
MPATQLAPRSPLRTYRALVAAMLFATTALGCASAPKVPTNFAQHKRDLLAFYDSGDYAAALAKAIAPARKILLRHTRTGEAGAVPATSERKLAIVLDIDETSLDNFQYEREESFHYDSDTWDAWVARGEAKVITPTLELFNLARERGVAVFFITGRRERGRAVTEANLRAVGYEGWQALYMKPDDDQGPSSDFKTAKRKEIAAQGYHILLNIGDQRSDLRGGHAEYTVLLPNPFYEIP